MLKKSIVLSIVGLATLSEANQCLDQVYNKLKSPEAVAVAAKAAKEATLAVRLLESKNGLTAEQKKHIDPLYMKLFENAFETEFSINLNEDYIGLFKRILFEPSSLTAAEIKMLRDGTMEQVAPGQENPQGSLLKNYLSLNHLMNERQEKLAEKTLTEVRKTGKPVQLTQLEIVALRVASIIGRDAHMLNGSPLALNEAQIKEMKYNFLSFFNFAGKELSRSEFEVLYAKKAIVDDLMSEDRYDYAQTYDPAYVTDKMIQDANQNLLSESRKWRNPFHENVRKELETSTRAKAAFDEVSQRIEQDTELRESLKYVRQQMAKDDMDGSKFFKSPEAFEQYLLSHKKALNLGMGKLSEDGSRKKLEILTRGLRTDSSYTSHMNLIKSKLNPNLEYDKKIIDFLASQEGRKLFFIAREELKHARPLIKFKLIPKTRFATLEKVREWLNEPQVTRTVLEEAFEKEIKNIEKVLALKRESPQMFEAVYKHKLVRTTVNEAEVNELYNILTYDSQLRPMDLVKWDPTSKFGFCFGRAYFGSLIMRHHGIHKDSIKKVFVYGPMSGGLFGWGFHVAVMVAREGGGFWVLDPTHGEPQTLEKWFEPYVKASKDGRIKMYVGPGDRFGRSFWGTPEWKNLSTNYESIWNKVLGTKLQYFKDNMSHMHENNFDRERNTSLIKENFDRILDIMNVGI
jgi:hypothetical protein